MRIGAEIISNDHYAFGLKLAQRLFHLILADIESAQ